MVSAVSRIVPSQGEARCCGPALPPAGAARGGAAAPQGSTGNTSCGIGARASKRLLSRSCKRGSRNLGHLCAIVDAQRRERRRAVVCAASSSASVDVDEESDYYAILGVPYSAGTDEIKRAYRRLAKEFHPDVSADDSSTEFAIFLNHVYETLSDPERRMAYDSIAGFEVGGINPFMDNSYERDMVFVDEFTCIGCRNCANVCGATFMMEEEWGRARVRQQGVDGVDKLQEAIDTCPVSCIHWVTAPQLALLEETMSRMERVAAWLLMTGGGKGANLNVFVEAATAWEKRQASLRAKVQADQGWGFWRATPAAGSSMQDSARAAADAAGTSSSLGRGVNAATVAAAARRWRDYQRAKRNKEQRLLSATISPSAIDKSALESESATSVH